MQVLMSHGLAAAHGADYHMHASRMSPQLRAIFLQGLAVTPGDLAAARAAQHSTRQFCHDLFEPPPTQPGQQPGKGACAGRMSAAAASADGPGSLRCDRYHIALSLPVLGVAPLKSEGTGSPRPASLWSLGGAPALAVPWGLSPEGLPLAVQLSAAHGADEPLLRVAAVVHAERMRETDEAYAPCD